MAAMAVLPSSSSSCAQHRLLRLSPPSSPSVASFKPLPLPLAFRSPFLSSLSPLRRALPHPAAATPSPLPRLPAPTASIGENPDWSDDDYIVVGLAHCFRQDESMKVHDTFLIEPISASTLECMDNGGCTCYVHAYGTTLGVALKLDASLLPSQFAGASFCEDFDFRAKCASRTWKRAHPVENLMKLLPIGSVRSDFNFSLADKRVINKEHVVNDSDNIKQDLSIDVYGRNKEEAKEEADSQIASLYNA